MKVRVAAYLAANFFKPDKCDPRALPLLLNA